ncbi:hypothetical protein DICSQDRAFT_111022 [Dichomitus squalens LYAD-421 SS1]|uniref:Fungal-type protein kinase domain-containing protein n=1 Tax=Dichomitus squalens (strain LYAD-421) TaxID=732165 RepID=R7SS99_DICSQ|nr:uncharacterized protein DICSQDRAFT_111022 [Dichomitus squalens LYAD-421 SS1]EJF57852.1 hypothetical protein DICSQDRAFT_111022 [Dichomitus squalens LYAD-421 SS1]
MSCSVLELPNEDFHRAFLASTEPFPWKQRTHEQFFTTLQDADELSEQDISERLIQAINSGCLDSGSRLSPQDSRVFFDASESVRHAAVFRSEHTSSLPSWYDQTVPVVFARHSTGGDPFDDAEYEDEYGEIQEERDKVMKHAMTVVEYLFAAQHRVFLFMILVIGRRFRLLRWDRAGIIVTPSVDYVVTPSELCDCLWHLSLFDDAALGFDPSATRVLPGDVDHLRMDLAAMKSAHDVDHTERTLNMGEAEGSVIFEYTRTLFRSALAPQWPRYRLEVTDNGTTRHFLVGRPVFRAGGTAGRGTRGYVALDCQTRQFVWLKDVWRAAYMVASREGDVLRKLNEAGVEQVPTLVCHGDVCDQATVTTEWWERKNASSIPSPSLQPAAAAHSSSRTLPGSASSGKRKREDDTGNDVAPSRRRGRRSRKGAILSNGPLSQHKHYRVVVKEVALPLKHFRNGRQLASVVLDGIRAHHQAATNPKTRLLHRDISGGNILIYPKVKRDSNGTNPAIVWTGLLVDWELSKPIDDDQTPSKGSQAEHMGTYQFMSVNILRDPSQPVKVSDELESFFHVLLYYCVRYLCSNCGCPTSYIENYFENYAGPGRWHTCGWKSLAMQEDDFLSNHFPPSPLLFYSPMDEILGTILRCFQSLYKVRKDDARKARGPPPPKLPPLESSDSRLAPIGDIPEIPFFGDDAERMEAEVPAPPPVDDDSPTPEDRERALKVHDHWFMIEHITKTLSSSEWPDNDREPSPAVKTQTSVSGSHGQSASDRASRPTYVSNKRRRIAGPERNVSLPARLHASTRRTRVKPCTLPVRAAP